MRNWNFREFRVQVNFSSPIRQAWVLIQCVITPIRGLPTPIRQGVPLISHIHLYPPHRSHLHPPSLSFSSTTQPSSQNNKLSDPCLSLHTMIMSWHRVQHTPSTVYTKYSIHQVQHTPSTAYTKYSIHREQHMPCTAYTKYSIHPRLLSSHHSHHCDLTPGCSFTFRRASLHDQPPSASPPWDFKGKVTLSHSHGCELTTRFIESPHPALRPSTASKYMSNLARSWPPSVSPNLLDYGL